MGYHAIMTPSIETLPRKHLVGLRTRMTLAEDLTRGLWQELMPRRTEIENRAGESYHSLKFFDSGTSYAGFTEHTEFEKWAAIEVSEPGTVPAGLEALTLPAGLYAMYVHHGPAAAFHTTLQAFFTEWLPQSNYEIDERAHFEILGPEYRPDDPNAEEEVWIPIRETVKA